MLFFSQLQQQKLRHKYYQFQIQFHDIYVCCEHDSNVIIMFFHYLSSAPPPFVLNGNICDNRYNGHSGCRLEKAGSVITTQTRQYRFRFLALQHFRAPAIIASLGERTVPENPEVLLTGACGLKRE